MHKTGLVTRSTGSWYDIYFEDENDTWQGRLRGRMRLEGLKVTNPIAVGDYVKVSVEDEQEKRLIIQEVLPRQNYLVRQSPRKRGHGHIIASNLDLILIVATMAYPRTSSGFIDRVLVSAEAFRIPVLIAFNKADRLREKDEAKQQEWQQMYEPLGYSTLSVSALEGTNITALEAALQGKKTLIVGHSGVGKSTLLNRISPAVGQRTQEISEFSEKGMHTTTFAEMFQLDAATFIIDTPGIKEMGLLQIGDQELSHYFPEMRQRLGQCKYHNCTHQHEPKCAILEAVKNEEIAELRYENYLRMLATEE